MFFICIMLLFITLDITAQQKTIQSTAPKILTFVCPYPLPLPRPSSVNLDDSDSDTSDYENSAPSMPVPKVLSAPITTTAQEVLQSIRDTGKDGYTNKN